MAEAAVFGSTGSFTSTAQRSQPLTRPQSAGSVRVRPGSAQAARVAVSTDHAKRSVAIWSDPKMRTLQGFVQKAEERDLDDEEVDDETEADLEAEVLQPAQPQSRRGSESMAAGSTQDLTLTLQSITSGLENAAPKASAKKSKAPKGQALRRSATASAILRRDRRPQRSGSAALNRQRMSGTDKFDRKVRDIAKEAAAQQQKLAQSKHLGQVLSSTVPASPTSVNFSQTELLFGSTQGSVAWGRRSTGRPLKEEQEKSLQRRTECFNIGNVRGNFKTETDRHLRRLFMDVDLIGEFGAEQYLHKSRCDHVDKVYDWYHRHAFPGQGVQVDTKDDVKIGTSSPWLFVSGDGPPPPGSLRVPKCQRPSPLLSVPQRGQVDNSAIGKSASMPALLTAN